MKGAKLFVATPMYGGMCYSPYALALSDLSVACRNYNVPLKIRVVNNDALIVNARNLLAHYFLADTDCTHMMFIDADVSFKPEHVFSLIEENKDLIAGNYPKKMIDWEEVQKAVKAGVPVDQLKYHTGRPTFAIIPGTEGEHKFENPLEVETVATGFMLIKRRVFEELAPLVDEYWHPDHKDRPIKNFFRLLVENTKLYSEDNSFCKLWRQHGGKVYLAPWVMLNHTGTYTFEGRLTGL